MRTGVGSKTPHLLTKMSDPPNPTNNDPNASRASHGPLQDAERYTAERIVSIYPGDLNLVNNLVIYFK